MLKEILKNCGVEEEKVNEIVKAMAEAKIYTTNLENVDVRYNKLQEQKKQLEEASKGYEKQLKELSKNNTDNEELKKQLGIPEGFKPLLCASFGYAAKEEPAKTHHIEVTRV